MTGGSGRSVFALERGSGRAIVKDFQLQQDNLGAPDLSFKDLTFEQKGSNTSLIVRGDRLMLLLNVNSSEIGADAVKTL